MKVTLIRNVIEVDVENMRELLQEDSLVGFLSPQLLLPHRETKKKNRRRNSGVLASQLIGEIIEGIEK